MSTRPQHGPGLAWEHVHSPLGAALRDAGTAPDEIVRTPRAIDAMQVMLRKVDLTSEDRAAFAHWRERERGGATAHSAVPAGHEAREVGTGEGDAPLAFLGPWETNRHRYCVYVVSPADYAHHAAFGEAAQALSAAFAALGGSAPVVVEPAGWQDRTPIVFGGHLLTRFPVTDLPPKAVLVNLEPMDTNATWMDADYLALLRRHPVLDYSLRNTQALKAAGIRHARHLAIRAMPCSAVAGSPEPDIDVLFYGSINERRRVVLDALRARGLSVIELFGVYGDERDAVVARAKIVLNVHFYEAAIFEAVRVCHVLARGACVVSEGVPDDPDITDIADGLVLCPYPKLVESCCALVADAAERRALSRRARAVIAASPQSAILRAFFLKVAPLPVQAA